MNRTKLIAIAGSLFPHYPKVDTFYITSDGQAFEKEHDAKSHARTFKEEEQQQVAAVYREDVEYLNKLNSINENMKASLSAAAAAAAPAGDQAPADPAAPAGDQAPAAPAVPAGDQAPAAPAPPAKGKGK